MKSALKPTLTIKNPFSNVIVCYRLVSWRNRRFCVLRGLLYNQKRKSFDCSDLT